MLNLNVQKRGSLVHVVAWLVSGMSYRKIAPGFSLTAISGAALVQLPEKEVLCDFSAKWQELAWAVGLL